MQKKVKVDQHQAGLELSATVGATQATVVRGSQLTGEVEIEMLRQLVSPY